MSLYTSYDPVEGDLVDVAYSIAGEYVRLWITNNKNMSVMTTNEARILVNKLQAAIQLSEINEAKR